MKIIHYWKIFNFNKIKKLNSTLTKLEHNKITMPDLDVTINKLHGETYRILRKFKAPQYQMIYCMRKKKAFNTFYFIQNYDVVITDRNGLVIDTLDNLKPGYVSETYKHGYSIFFMVVGSIKHYNIRKKDMLKIIRLSDWY